MKKSFWIASLFVLAFLGWSEPVENENLIQLSHESGYYNENITLRISSLSPTLPIRYQFSSNKGEIFVPYKCPLFLDALIGEERRYELTIQAINGNIIKQQKQCMYIIDKKNPQPPRIKITSDTGLNQLYLQFITKDNVQVFYAVDDKPSNTNSYKKWSGLVNRISYDQNSEKHIYAFSVDRAGNKSSVVQKKIHPILFEKSVPKESKKTQDIKEIEILSPKSGNFLNNQLLYIKSAEKCEWIKYTLDDQDPCKKGGYYTKPIRIEQTGKITLRVCAKRKDMDDSIQKKIVFTQSPKETFPFSIQSGVYSKELVLSPNIPEKADFRYTLNDEIPQYYDLPLTSPIHLQIQEGMVSEFFLRMKNINQKTEEEYRYSFLLDGRLPPEPIIEMHDEKPITTKTQIFMQSSTDAKIYYTTDGTIPNKQSNHYTNPITIVPETGKEGTIILKARSRLENGNWSNITEFEIPYDTKIPPSPVIHMKDETSPYSKQFSIESSADSSIIYEIAYNGETPSVPNNNSPSIPSNFSLRIPYGMRKSFTFAFSSIDLAGNISKPTRIDGIVLDAIPPPPPRYDKNKNTITLSSTYKIIYRLVNQIDTPSEKSYKDYSGPIILGPDEVGMREFYLFTYSQKQNGLTSEEKCLGPFIVDNRKITLPPYFGIQDGGYYNCEKLSLRFNNANKKLKIYYTISNTGKLPPDPMIGKSPYITDQLNFKCKESEETTYKVKLLPAISSVKKGFVHELTFFMDRKPPELPTIHGVKDENTYSKDRTLALKPANPRDTLFISLTDVKNKVPPDPLGENGMTYANPIILSCPEEQERQYHLKYAAKDRAGNTKTSDETVTITIDKIPPKTPYYESSEKKELTNKNVTVRLLGEENIYYILSKEGKEPRNRVKAKPYTGPIQIEGKKNKEQSFSLTAYAEDSAGNLSTWMEPYHVTIDRLNPLPPQEPSVTIESDNLQNILSISWPSNGQKIYYRIYSYKKEFTAFTDKEKNKEEWKEFAPPFMTHGITKNAYITIEYYARDKAGNQSTIQTKTIQMKKKLSLPHITGIKNGEHVSSSVTLKNLTQDGEVRYKLLTDTKDNTEDTNVTRFSPLMGKTLSIDVPKGKTTHFALHTRTFDPKNSGRYTEEEIINFVIDKTAPAPPKIEGIEDGGYYAEDVRFSLDSSEGKIFLKIERDHQETGFSQFTGPVSITIKEGSLHKFSVYAHTKDAVGNKSNITPVWNFTIDKKNIYVSKNGNDNNTGSRDKPLKSLSKALRLARITASTQICLAEGIHELDIPLSSFKNFSIIGGYNSKSWTISKNRSHIQLADGFPFDKPIIDIQKNNLKIANIDLELPVFYSSIPITVRSGSIFLKNVSIYSVNGKQIVHQQGGELIISNSTFQSELVYSSLISATNGKLNITTSVFKANGPERDYTVLSIKDGTDLFLSDSEIHPLYGNSTKALESQSSSIVCKNTKMDTGSGSVGAVGMKLVDSTFTGEGITINTNRNTHITTGINTIQSDLFLKKCVLDISGLYGSTALFVRDGTIEMRDSDIRTDKTRDFQYLINLSRCKGIFVNNHFKGEVTGDYIGVLSEYANTSWKKNIFEHGYGKNKTKGFHLTINDDSYMEYHENTFKQENQNTGTAFFVEGSFPDSADEVTPINEMLLFEGNIFYGWENLFQYSPSTPSKGYGVKRKVKLSIESMSRFNQLFESKVPNKIDP